MLGICIHCGTNLDTLHPMANLYPHQTGACGSEYDGAENQENHIHSFNCINWRPVLESFWTVEKFEGGKSAGYWDGANSRSFVGDIEKAIQFRRKHDAFWATRGWHWTDVQITEHLMLAAAPAPWDALKRKIQHIIWDAVAEYEKDKLLRRRRSDL